ncbi:helix-turn-helix transcriptional regulator [Nocardioides insulae]|uniref:helix-turn-helix transcriptional regulator n=1 Tax=Nocardioides insulae TaxID=394734 RepID=UPI00041E8209|nr:WYL domain-containing protein [Nocardioides insulae]
MSARTAHNAKEQVGRLLALVPYLHRHGIVGLEEAAADLGVPPRQLAKDVRVLFLCGLPGGYPDDLIDVDLDALEDPDDAVIRVSNADYLSRPMRLTPVEASALIVALRALRDGAESSSTRELVDRTLAKFERAAAEGAAQVEPGVEAPDLALVRLADRLRDAVARGVQVRLDYWVPARDERSTRLVDPQGVVTHQGQHYLDAWCHSAEAPRLFRLDRIETAEVLDTPVSTPPAGPRDLGEGFFGQADELTEVTLRVAPGGQWITEYYPVEDTRALPDGDLEVDLRVADQRWLLRLLLRLAPYVTVVSPRVVGDAFISQAGEALDLYT